MIFTILKFSAQHIETFFSLKCDVNPSDFLVKIRKPDSQFYHLHLYLSNNVGDMVVYPRLIACWILSIPFLLSAALIRREITIFRNLQILPKLLVFRQKYWKIVPLLPRQRVERVESYPLNEPPCEDDHALFTMSPRLCLI